jgi:hypothetical protein
MTSSDKQKSSNTSHHHVSTRHTQSARIRQTDYGAVVELAGGRRISLWAFALDEPVLEVALRRARRDGATHILIEFGPAG